MSGPHRLASWEIKSSYWIIRAEKNGKTLREQVNGLDAADFAKWLIEHGFNRITIRRHLFRIDKKALDREPKLSARTLRALQVLNLTPKNISKVTIDALLSVPSIGAKVLLELNDHLGRPWSDEQIQSALKKKRNKS